MRQRALAALDDAVAAFHGDPARIYVTGNSMGGYGTWALGAHHPDRFAALVPIAGGVRPPFNGKLPDDPLFKAGEDPELSVARAVSRTPVWIFHGRHDWMVAPGNSRRMAERLKQVGGDVRYSELDVGHASEELAYAMPELFDWLLAQHR